MTSSLDAVSIGSASSESPPSKTPPPAKPPTPLPPSTSEHVYPIPPPIWRTRICPNRGLFILLLLSQFFASLMALTARLLETGHYGPQHFHAHQILFVRQSISTAGFILWMWYRAVPSWPFGSSSVRPLLIVRGVGGFFGVFSLYYSLTYLDLSDATVITFLAPMVASYACSVIPALKEPFTKAEAAATGVSFFGVVMLRGQPACSTSTFPNHMSPRCMSG